MAPYTDKEDEEIWDYIRNYTDEKPNTDPNLAFFEKFKRRTGSTRSAFSLSMRFKTTLSGQLCWKFDEPTRKRLAERFNLYYSGCETRRFSRRLQADGTPIPIGRRPSSGRSQQVDDENEVEDVDIPHPPSPVPDVLPNEERDLENQENIDDPEDLNEDRIQENIETDASDANVAPTDDSRDTSILEFLMEDNSPKDHGLGILMTGFETVVEAIGDERMKALFQVINARYQTQHIFPIDELKRVVDAALRMFDRTE